MVIILHTRLPARDDGRHKAARHARVLRAQHCTNAEQA
jgi:hypothetical protein